MKKTEAEYAAKKAGWLETRRTGIGGSEAAAVLGLCPWLTPYALWAQKTGLIDPPARESILMEWGKKLEPLVAEAYAQETGRKLLNYGEFHVFRNSRHPFLVCTADRGIREIPGKSGKGILEIKTTNAFRAHDWDEEVPPVCRIQIQHNLLVTDRSWGSAAVLIGGSDFRWVDAERDNNFCRLLLEKEEEFWDLVQKGEPPDVDGSEVTTEALRRLYPTDNGLSVKLPDEALIWDRHYREAQEIIDYWEKVKNEIRNRLVAAMGEASIGVLPDGGGAYSYKLVHKKEYTVPPKDYRMLRRLINVPNSAV